MGHTVPEKTRRLLVAQIPLWYNTAAFPPSADPLGVVQRVLHSPDKRVPELAAFFAALFAWGRRDIAIAKTEELLSHLVVNGPSGLAVIQPIAAAPGFKHRTFTTPQTQVLVLRLQDVFDTFGTLEQAFAHFAETGQAASQHPGQRVERALNGFRQWFFEPEWTKGVAKHLASPEKGSACKRLNLMLRWLCRPADACLDCGLWSCFSPAELIMPLDVHVIRAARHFGLLKRATPDWKAALELTEACRQIVPQDPLLLDYVLFGIAQSGALKSAKIAL